MNHPGPLDRTVPPGAGALRRFDFPPVHHTRLPSGLDLRVVRMDRLPIVASVLVLDAGEALLPDPEAGLALLTALSLQGGTAHRSGADLAEALEQRGVQLSYSAGWHSTMLSMTSHADHLEGAWRLLSEVVAEPSFPEEEVGRVREQRLAALRQHRMTPTALADDLVGFVVYGPGHPYGRPSAGMAQALEGMTGDEARGWHRDRYAPAGSSLVVVGDVDVAEAEALAGDTFAGWTSPGVSRGAPDFGPIRSPEARIVVAHRPGAVQSELRVCGLGTSRTDPAYFPLQVLNTVLGGAFTSRLNLNLRERNGFTYGVRSGFSFRRGPGPFTIRTAVGTDVTAAAAAEALHELRNLLESGPTEDEVSAARDYLAGVFPLRMETSDRIASQLSRVAVYGLPDDHLATYRDHIRAVTPQSALDAGRRILRPDQMVLLVVGDADAVTPGLEALGHGPVEVLESGTLPPFYP